MIWRPRTTAPATGSPNRRYTIEGFNTANLPEPQDHGNQT